jgi:hypothetical protein
LVLGQDGEHAEERREVRIGDGQLSFDLAEDAPPGVSRHGCFSLTNGVTA